MKKIMVLALAIVITGTVFAGPSKKSVQPDAKVLNAFEKDFIGTTNITWSSDADYFYVSFQLNGENTNAVYAKADASFIGYASLIDADHLPSLVRNELKNNFGDFTISGKVLSIGYENTNAYEMVLENEKKILKVRFQEGEFTYLKRLQKM
jgi:hypothetical protein